ncbi:unnamed protein product [marine sediment metagenome]|uniref:Uncharacterized protein n=1 Tax=marine sediment metagenome TaxID=412755 RepID=X1A6T3_9ZZZZ
MPQIGEIKLGKEIGRYSKNKFMWAACPDCGLERWVRLCGVKLINKRCCSCSNKYKAVRGENHPSWKGGRKRDGYGYI